MPPPQMAVPVVAANPDEISLDDDEDEDEAGEVTSEEKEGGCACASTSGNPDEIDIEMEDDEDEDPVQADEKIVQVVDPPSVIASVSQSTASRTTKFLALSKPGGNRDFLQVSLNIFSYHPFRCWLFTFLPGRLSTYLILLISCGLLRYHVRYRHFHRSLNRLSPSLLPQLLYRPRKYSHQSSRFTLLSLRDLLLLSPHLPLLVIGQRSLSIHTGSRLLKPLRLISPCVNPRFPFLHLPLLMRSLRNRTSG